MAAKETVTLEVKSNIGSTTKDVKGLASEFQIMGVSLKSIGSGFKSFTSIAKKSFSSLNNAIKTSLIGVLLASVISLVSFFTKTKKGAELLETAFAAVGAAVSVIVDRVSKFGGAIVKLFQGDAKGALKDVKGAFKGIGEEIANDTREAIKLNKAFQNLRDSERELSVETAQRRAEIEALKLIAEDVTNTEQVRLKAAKDAFAIENKLLNQRVANAKEAVRIQKEQNEINQSMDADLDALAQKEIDLANIKAESTTKQIELNNKINAIEAEAAAKRLEALNQLKEADKERRGELTEMPKLAENAAQGMIKADNSVLDNFLKNNEKRKKLTQEELDEEERIADNKKQMNIAIANQGLEILGKAAGEGTAIAKGAAIAQATIAGTQSVINAFNSANANVGATAGTFGAYPITMASLAATFAAMNIAKIASGGKPSASGGGGGGSAPQTPAPQMMSGAFELGGGIKPEPMKAFVVTDEMSNSQNQLANIRRTATI